MTPKKIFILDGHPAASSLSRSLAETMPSQHATPDTMCELHI